MNRPSVIGLSGRRSSLLGLVVLGVILGFVVSASDASWAQNDDGQPFSGPSSGDPSPSAASRLNTAEMSPDELRSELARVQMRVRELEAKLARCEPPILSSGEGDPSLAEDPAQAAQGEGDDDVTRRDGLPTTGQTLAEKLTFLAESCVARVGCAVPLVRKRQGLAGMGLLDARVFASSVSQCAHRCAVEIAVSRAVDGPSVQQGTTLPLSPSIGTRGPSDPRGVILFPPRTASTDQFREFLTTRCQELPCARLSMTLASAGDGPKVRDFVLTCAEACAETKNLQVGE